MSKKDVPKSKILASPNPKSKDIPKKDVKRMVKKAKIADGFTSCGYEVTNWYVDPLKNSCVFMTVKNVLNSIEFLCMSSKTHHLSVDAGLYLFPDHDVAPDVEDALSMWDECEIETLFIRIADRVILKSGKDYTVYTVSEDRPAGDDLTTLEQYANQLDVIEDDGSSSASSRTIIKKRNPFDILVDGGDFQKVASRRVEDVQPCILVDYNGYTLGQAVPVIEFGTFFDRDDPENNINEITKQTRVIYEFQNSYIKRLFGEAISSLDEFTKSLKTSYEDYGKDVENAESEFLQLQNILEKVTGTSRTNDICTKAHGALRDLLSKQLEKRDNIIGLLDHVRETFGEI